MNNNKYVTYCCDCKHPLKNNFDDNFTKCNVSYLCNKCVNNNKYENIYDIIQNNNIKPNDIKLNLFVSNTGIFVLNVDKIMILKTYERRIILMSVLRKQKIEYVNCTICNAYIRFGNPTIEKVVEHLKQLQYEKNTRMLTLLTELAKAGMLYDKNIPVYDKYVKNTCDISDVIKCAKLEQILIKCTKYLELIKKYGEDEAKVIASRQYLNMGGKNKNVNNFIKSKITLRFD
jgi:hypothetical protein